MRFRVVRDNFAGFEVQFRVWWFPFWVQCGVSRTDGTNTHRTLEAAQAFIAMKRRASMAGEEVWREA